MNEAIMYTAQIFDMRTGYIRNVFTLLLTFAILGSATIKSSAQNTPNNKKVSAPTTQTLRGTPAAYNSSIPINFIKIWEATGPEGLESDLMAGSFEQVKKTTKYVDGLGRPLQNVTQGISPSGKDLVSMYQYDAYGRAVFNNVAYVSPTLGGNIKMDPFNEQQTFLDNYFNASTQTDPDKEKFFYGKTSYEPSPLKRVIKVTPPGNSWTGSNIGVSTEYFVNSKTVDDVKIWNIGSTAGSLPAVTGVYDDGQLYKTVITDERGYQIIEYKDKEGKVILKKTEIGTTSETDAYAGFLSTYYIYDDLGNLRFVLQPKCVAQLKSAAYNWVFDGTNWASSILAKELCFSYEFDARNRTIVKRVPGAGEVWMVYDDRDRLIMTQDENLRNNNKWLYTKYDALNRSILTGLWTTTGNRDYHQGLANGSSNYPDPSTGVEILSETFYDDYNWIAEEGPALRTTLIGTYINNQDYFFQSSGTAYPYPRAIKAHYQANNMVTGTKVKVLGTTDTYLYAVNFYDDRGRLIQTQSINESGARDTVTTQYGFAGQVLRTLVSHKRNNPGTQFHTLLTKMEYDAAGRLKKIFKKSDNSPEVLTVENEYDEFGQLKTKSIGRQRNSDGLTFSTIPIDKLDYTYNIRGWLTGINKGYANPEVYNGTEATNQTGRWFGIELSYDYGFQTGYTNGNIAGTIWKSRGDGEKRAYGFTYDKGNRITKSDFRQFTSGTYNTDAGIDFSVGTITYDQNGNITQMQQKGLKGITSEIIDDLTYNYDQNGKSNHSNKLNYVTDVYNDASTTLGDFKEPVKDNTQDYWYDGNGNLVKDNNKKISAITYNYLSLPQTITIDKGSISYTYDAAGNKLKKVTVESASNQNGNREITTTTFYMGIYVYESKSYNPTNPDILNYNARLQFISHEEGRIRPKDPTNKETMYYDYFEKDHLGNVRVVLTDELKQDIYPAATLEGTLTDPASAIYIENNFFTIDPNKVVPKSQVTGITDYENNNGNPPVNNNSNSNTTAFSEKLYKLAATSSGGVIGLGTTLKVMSGDKIDIFGKSYYFSNNVPPHENYDVPVADIVAGLLGSPTGATAGKGVTAMQLNGNAGITGGIAAFLDDADRDIGGIEFKPKAYINYILFDENFKFVKGGFSRVNAQDIVQSHNSLQNINVAKNGFLYVYVSNESVSNVFFDNLQVIHTRGPLIEETHYYPFGLTMSGISSRAVGGVENKKKYNGYEQNTDFDLNVYESFYRTHDPQIGRFLQIDPKPNGSESPYVAMGNNPVLNFDVLGDTLTKEQLIALFEQQRKERDNEPKHTAHFRQATDDEWQENPWNALTLNAGFFVAEFLGWTAVDNAISTVQDENASTGDKVMAVVGAGLATTGGKSGEHLPVEKYEVGTYNDLKARSQKNDGLDIHHVPQSKPAEQLFPGYDKKNAPSIALPNGEHGQIPNLKGTNNAGTPRQQLARDINNLRNNTNAPVQSIQKLVDLNKQLFPFLYKK